MNQPALVIGIDVGGTQTRLASVNRNGEIGEIRRESTNRNGSADAWLSQMATFVTELCANVTGTTDETFVGLAVPGTLDADRRKIVRCVSIPSFEGHELACELRHRIAAHVSLLTDAEAATMGEFAAHSPTCDRFMHLRIGTGIACGLMVGRRLQRLDTDRRTHMEALRVDESSDAISCACGLSGCLEAYVSGPAINKQAKNCGIDGGLGELRRRWLRGDSIATSLVSKAAGHVARALEKLRTQFAPDIICIGGGVALHLPALLDEACAHFAKTQPHSGAGSTCIVHAKLGDNAGVIGAARLAELLQHRRCQ